MESDLETSSPGLPSLPTKSILIISLSYLYLFEASISKLPSICMLFSFEYTTPANVIGIATTSTARKITNFLRADKKSPSFL